MKKKCYSIEDIRTKIINVATFPDKSDILCDNLNELKE